MKAFRLFLIAVLCAIAARAAAAAPDVKLTGIAQLPGRTVGLFEIKSESARGAVMKPVLVAGERIESVEVISIDPKAAKAVLNIDGKVAEAALGSAVDTDQSPTLHLKDAGSRQVLEVYQELSGRTVLPSPSLPATAITLKSAPGLSRVAAVDALTQALRDAGIIVTPRHEKFAFATSISHVPRLAQIPEAPAPVQDGKDEKGEKSEVFPPGLMKFNDADVSQVLGIYQELTGRTLLVSPNLPPAKISFKTQTALSRAEAIWVLDAMLYLATIKTVPEWTKFTYVLPATRNAAAPKIPDNPAEALLKKKDPVAAGTLVFSDSPRGIAPPVPGLPKGVPPAPPALDPLAAYAKLIDREPLVERGAPSLRAHFRNQTSLHAVEAVYALDALAALHHLRFVLVGEKQVKIVPVSEAGKSAGQN